MLRKKANGVAVGSQVSSLLKNVVSHKWTAGRSYVLPVWLWVV